MADSTSRNLLTLVGHPHDVNDFVRRASGKPDNGSGSVLQFESFVPAGPSYEHEREAWGVKWGAYNELLVYSGSTTKQQWRATYYFDTAEGPPNVFLKKVSAMYSGTTFLLSWVQSHLWRGRWLIKDGIIDIVSEEVGRLNSPNSRDGATYLNYLDNHYQWVEDALFAKAVEVSISE